MEYLSISGWEKWQTYRTDRGQPPWIKIYRDLLRNWEWMCLTDCQRGQLVAIWLLAGDRGGVIPASSEVVQRMCSMTDPIDLNLFIELGFIDQPDKPLDASVTPYGCQRDATVTNQSRLETETETENKKTCIKSSGKEYANGSDFDRFWVFWPDKRNKKKARDVFIRKKFSITDVDELIADVELRKRSDKRWLGGFIPHCSTYLNGERWEDEYGR